MDYLKIIGENILPVLFTILTPILILLVKRLVVYLEKKWSFKMTIEQQKKLNDLIEDSVAFAEEKAKQAMRTDPAGLPDGAKKLDTALGFAMEQIERLGLDKMAEEALAKLIESKLFKMRVAGAVAETLKVQ